MRQQQHQQQLQQQLQQQHQQQQQLQSHKCAPTTRHVCRYFTVPMNSSLKGDILEEGDDEDDSRESAQLMPNSALRLDSDSLVDQQRAPAKVGLRQKRISTNVSPSSPGHKKNHMFRSFFKFFNQPLTKAFSSKSKLLLNETVRERETRKTKSRSALVNPSAGNQYDESTQFTITIAPVSQPTFVSSKRKQSKR